MKSSSYAGIGSRQTPEPVLKRMREVAAVLDAHGYTLRSGAADGADAAFESGASIERSQIFLPWRNFNRHPSDLYIGSARVASAAAEKMAARFHPNWSACTSGARLMHTRNCFQVLGARLDDPVAFVVCWTQGGKMTGGTAQALRIAEYYDIPVFNLGAVEGERRLEDMLKAIQAHG